MIVLFVAMTSFLATTMILSALGFGGWNLFITSGLIGMGGGVIAVRVAR